MNQPDNLRSGTPATLEDVAKDAGVSLATASRVLNGSVRKVAESYRERVVASAAKLGYSPNLSAQAMALGASKTVALVVSDIADPYFSSIAAGVIAEADARGLSVLMAASGRRTDRELELVRALRGQRPQVLIVAGSRIAEDENAQALVEELAAYARAGGQVVALSQPTLSVPTIDVDNRAGAQLLAQEMVRLGYRRIAVIAGPENLLTSSERLAGFSGVLAEAGITIERIERADFSRDGGYAAAEALLEGGIAELELVFAVSDIMAVGAMARLREAGVRMPEDLSIAGFDDIPTLRDISPALTTVTVPLEQLGADAVTLALAGTTAGAEAEATTDAPRAPGAVVLRASTPGVASQR